MRRAKRQSKVLEENHWDCSVCTYRNTAEAFKCLMCDVRKGTSTRKPRLNPALVAQQAALPGGAGPNTAKRGADGKTRTSRGSLKKRRSHHPPRLKNVDRSSAQTREVTVNSVTVVITEYKPKKALSVSGQSVSSSSSDVESSDTKPWFADFEKNCLFMCKQWETVYLYILYSETG